MKALTRLAAAAVLALGATSATQVAAGPTCGACFYSGTTTYIGSFDPTAGDTAFFLHNVPAGPFGDTWVFDIAPVPASGQSNVNFVLEGSVASFAMTLYATNPLAQGSCLILGGACAATPGLGAVLGSAGLATPGASAPLNFSNLGVGRYVLQVNGTSTAGSSLSGQLKVFVPEPGSLALAGLGLIAAAAGLRRRKSV